jgi:hypothetical protein
MFAFINLGISEAYGGYLLSHLDQDGRLSWTGYKWRYRNHSTVCSLIARMVEAMIPSQ